MLVPIVKLLILLAGWSGTQLVLMAMLGPYLDGLWLRFGTALVVAIAVPAVIADRLLPDTDPKPRGLVTTVFAVTWLTFPAVFVLTSGTFGPSRLAAEGERLSAEGHGAPAELSFLLAGGRDTDDADTTKPAVAEAEPTSAHSVAPSAPKPSAAPQVPPPTPRAAPEPSVRAGREPPTPEPSASPKVEAPKADDGRCTYPTGPYGIAKGDVLPPTLTWKGFAPGAKEPSSLSPRDVFDCDGDRGIDAVIIDTSQFG